MRGKGEVEAVVTLLAVQIVRVIRSSVVPSTWPALHATVPVDLADDRHRLCARQDRTGWDPDKNVFRIIQYM